MAETTESPGRRRLSPPVAGARPQQRDRPGLTARAGPRRAYVATYGASRANGQAAAEILGLVTR